MCLTPISVKNKRIMNKDYAYNTVPCGKCPACRRRRANSWIFRLLQEEKVHTTALFVTLTYDNENLPLTDKGFKTLRKRDPQLFFKRLRKLSNCKTIKYYLCGEYGSNTWRPHYHAIIFDATKTDIEKSWLLGNVHFGDVTGASIGYCVKYLDKEARIPLHANDDRVPEFALMSKKMGSNYLTPQMVKYHRTHQEPLVTLEGGHRQVMPRYYRDKIWHPEDDSAVRVKMRLKAADKHNKAFEVGVDSYGSVEEYMRVLHYSVRQQISDFNNITKQNRNKL